MHASSRPIGLRSPTKSSARPDPYDTSAPSKGTSMSPLSMSQTSATEHALLQGEAKASRAQDTNRNAQVIDAKTSHDQASLNPQGLLEPSIMLQYGPNCQKQHMVHPSMLLPHSPKLRHLFEKAEDQRCTYAESTSLRKKLKALLPPQTLYDDFCEEKKDVLVPEAITLILKCFNSYPLLDRRVQVKTYIANDVDELFQISKYLKAAPSAGGFKRKDYPKNEVHDRLKLFVPAGVHITVKRLCQRLWEIKRMELNSLQGNPIKAAAQRKIFLPNFDGFTIASFAQWVYFRTLQYQNAEQLCGIHTLAVQLEVGQLAHASLSLLSETMRTSIQLANQKGFTLRALIDEDVPGPSIHEIMEGMPAALVNVVPVVFRSVLQEHSTSRYLQRLVINAMANSADLELFNFLRPYFGLEMSLDLNGALFARPSRPTVEETEENHVQSRTAIKPEALFEEKAEHNEQDLETAGDSASTSTHGGDNSPDTLFVSERH